MAESSGSENTVNLLIEGDTPGTCKVNPDRFLTR
jgi:hypothetical protein